MTADPFDSRTSDAGMPPPAVSRSHPSALFVEVTSRCNFACAMCVRQTGLSPPPEGDLPPAYYHALEPAFPHLETLILNGVGEPLLVPELEGFIERARARMPGEASIGFQTNGALLDRRRADRLIQAGLDRICLSVDSIRPDRFGRIREGGNMADVQTALASLDSARRKAPGARLGIGIEFVLMRENLHELPDVLEWAGTRGVDFALVTQLLPYAPAMASHAAYDTNTLDAIAVYRTWRRRAAAEGLDIRRFYKVFMKVYKNGEEHRLCDLVEAMKDDAAKRGIALQLDRLFSRDESWLNQAEEILEAARAVAQRHRMALTLPGLAPRNTRVCEFVEGGSAFVSFNGDVHPCYFLWHRYACHVGGWAKQVRPWVFDNLARRDILAIWNTPDFRAFREQVVRYEFPFCFDCNFALCDLVERDDFEQDCYTGRVPCGACLWCTGLFHCLR